MTPLRQRMIEDMRVRNYSSRTQYQYTYHVARFANYFGKSLELLGPEEIRIYQLHLVNDLDVSWSTLNLCVSSLRFLYKVTLQKTGIFSISLMQNNHARCLLFSARKSWHSSFKPFQV